MTVPNPPYLYGAPDTLYRIHFPHQKNRSASEPWFYWLRRQTPTYFQYIGSQLGGQGWQCAQFLPVIRILPIDTQKMTPTTEVGFGSLEEAIDRTNNGEPISQDAWGRFRFVNKFFWKVMGWGDNHPEFQSKKGLLIRPAGSRQSPIGPVIQKVTQDWQTRWQAGAEQFNADCNAVTGLGSYGIPTSHFDVPLPVPGIPLPELQRTVGQWYFGPVPPFYIFETGQALIWKQSYSFIYEVSQLNSDEWDMSVFPPHRAPKTKQPFHSPYVASSTTGDFSGYGGISFPLTPPIIAGTV